MRNLLGVIVILSATIASVCGDFNEAYICSACTLILGLVEQAGLQIRLETYLKEQCGGVSVCEATVHHFILSIEKNANPDVICADLQLCSGECPLYSKWPVDPLPPQPIPWPVERRSLSEKTEWTQHVTPIFLDALGTSSKKHNLPLIAHTLTPLAKMLGSPLSKKETDVVQYEPCGNNITCHIDAIVNHNAFQDSDGDRFSTIKRLRGTDWSGADCDDSRGDVYPGRRQRPQGEDASEVDHNCNGIFGGNSSGLFEDFFCADYQPRGLIMLGDSATAHFHIPPQWVTAQGWNLDGLLQVAENELDAPGCSWGTGHLQPEECPFQHPAPGINGVTSLYTQLRERNRCNHNDYQNIGVNGARMTSSMQLAKAIARDPKNDNPALVWLSLIGNDVCNGHPGFDHMTTPENYYTSAMETLNALDTILPPGSHVVSLALFEGELLYDVMHSKQHPVGSTYVDLYNFMNCLEENPCWGWLNSNATNRRLTTQRSNELNRVSMNISMTASFTNFKFIFYSPVWATIFSDYETSGNPFTDLIEAVDGFHPSQTGNALFAQSFWKWLEENHPDALGPVNPHNAEIDALFFKDKHPQPQQP